MRVGELRVQTDRLVCGLLPVLVARAAPVHVPLRDRHRRPGRRVGRVEFYRALAEADDDLLVPLVAITLNWRAIR